MKDTKIGIALFQKKAEFGTAKSNITQLRMVNFEKEYVVENGSMLIVDGHEVTTDDKAAKALMAEMYWYRRLNKYPAVRSHHSSYYRAFMISTA